MFFWKVNYFIFLYRRYGRQYSEISKGRYCMKVAKQRKEHIYE